MSEDQKVVKEFLHVTRLKADFVLNAAHINNEAKIVVKDLLQICNNFEVLASANIGGSADASLLKRRYEQSKQEMTKIQNQLDTTIETLQSVIVEIVKVSSETNILLKANSADPDGPAYKALIRIKQALSQMAERISKPK